MKTVLQIAFVQHVGECRHQYKCNRKNLDTQVQLPLGMLNTCQASALMCDSRLRIVPTLVNSRRGDFFFHAEPCNERIFASGEPLREGMAQVEQSPTCLISRFSSSFCQRAGCNSSRRNKASVGKATIARDCSNAKRPTDGIAPSTTLPYNNVRGGLCSLPLSGIAAVQSTQT
jgi:hypothetical protein